MIINKITLAFSKEDEKLYLKKYYSDSVFQCRIALILVIIIIGAFGYLDMKVVPEHQVAFQAIRFLFFIPVLLIVFLLSFTRLFRKIWQILLLISFILSGCAISIMLFIAPNNIFYFGGMIMVFFAGYFFLKLRFFMATIAGWSILIIYNIGAIFFTQTSEILLTNNNFFFIGANIMGMFAAYYVEYYSRHNFLLNRSLNNEKLIVIDAKENLEKKVKEKTYELLKAKEKAEESDRLKTAFLANMSHEIRTPMNGILGFTTLLQDSNLSLENQKNYIDIIEKSGNRLLSTVNDIIEISKIESGDINVTKSEVDIIGHLNTLVTFFRPEAEKKNIDIILQNSIDGNDLTIATDKNKLSSILSNLIKNAIKYTNEGTINVGLKVENNQILFSCQDTGIGIPKNRQEAIFNRFEQADIEDKQVHQGSGLGLAIVKSYVEMLGGKIWVESEEGKGSTFYVSFPYENEKKKEQIIPQEVKSSDSGIKNINVLIVEDDEFSSMHLSAVMEGKVKNITTAKNGIEAIDACKNDSGIDLILMDIKMPVMDGFEATKRIRKFNKDVIIIAQTAYALEGDKEKALDAGCNDYISKPIGKNKLWKLINKYFLSTRVAEFAL